MNLKLLIFITLYIITLSGIGVDLYTPSMPAIAKEFQVHVALVKLTLSSYLIGFAVGQVTFGTLSDSFGRKKALLSGLLLFIIVSFIAPFTKNVYMLMLIRVLQGLGAASASVIAKAILSDSLSGKQLAIGSSYLTTVWACGPIIAPVIGGYFQYYFGWRANFYFYAIYTFLLFLTVTYLYQETNKNFLPLHLPTITRNFKEILSHRIFVGGVLSLGLGYSLIIIFNIAGPFLIQNTLGYSSIVFGHVALFVGSAYFVGTLINRILLYRLMLDTIIRIGLIIMTITSFVYLFIAYEITVNIMTITIPLFIIVLAVGLIFPNCMGKCLSLFPEKGGTASSVLGCLFVLCTAITSSIISILKPGTLVPVAWSFVILVILQLLVYWLMFSEV